MIESAGPSRGESIEVLPVVITTSVFPARPSSVPEIQSFLRRCLSDSPLTEVDSREVGKTIYSALLEAAGSGMIQVSCRRYPNRVEFDVLPAETPRQAPPEPEGPEPTATFAEWMAETLRGKGITREMAADQLGVSPKTVGRWLGGQTEPRLRELRRIQERFGDVRLQ
ncbi:Helix-turn-helix [Amycolatopsis xylanica]|uniref:Helix-turn-helix n=1 Tax=Amycolatopsis xylanica TaxID=589385 RepID=A0A1H2TX31_9PSEU|nr:helix-turn-helix transcriptional regulator [Amycolatopsis xylanica]SDW48298.1 Helix-turn-helix [Amycolatopsis xylanica]